VSIALFLFPVFSLTAQKPTPKIPAKKYQALLWEITGNGLPKPSYLFGTMHVSSKLVFHLSDSFYLDLKNSDVVALELDPQLWQDQLFRFQNMQTNLRFYTQGSPGDYINEKSFQLEKYEDKLKSALSDEPTIINGLLYRSFRARADFEEDTYLDLYIYQTGKKLGKQATGVENYFETEQLIMEAAQDMMKDKKKRSSNLDGESSYDIEKKAQEAYRRGDLDMLDSLEKLMQPSESYLEKFLYRRNEIQANSVDSILREHSLFVGVGAAHLPGKRGVIELLRKKGYTLRPVGMQDRDATQKENVDKIKVPVNFSSFSSDDGQFTVQLPGKLYKRADSHSTDSWQYADMSNGAYYMIGRVRTHACFLGNKDQVILEKLDSLLYENIPGKMLKKMLITKSGYKGYDITSKTRRGDIQRYNILVTPFEVLVFKMSGNGSYVDGKEADQFFGSIQIKKTSPPGWMDFIPPQGGFRIRLPRTPYQTRNSSSVDGMPRWEYEANDETTGDAFLVWKKTIQNYRFLEEDTVDLGLIEESFQLSEWIDKPLSRHTGLYKGYPCLDATYLNKEGAYIKMKCLLKGPHYYLLAVRSNNGDKQFPEFFDSFAFTPYRYAGYRNYTDTFMNITVTTPVVPDIDAGLRTIMERGASEEFLNSIPEYNNYWPRTKTALFQDDSSGEAVFVSMETYPKYYYPQDSSGFWKEANNEKKLLKDFVLRSKEPFRFNDSVGGYKFIFTDTNTSRLINSWIFLKDNRLYRMISLNDSLASDPLHPGSDFISRFYGSLRPMDKRLGESVFTNKLGLFFKDFYSRDSLTGRKAREVVSNVYFGAAGLAALLKAIQNLPYNNKDYFSTKTSLINELGFIRDSGSVNTIVAALKKIYEKVADTTTFQNAVLKALAHHKTRPAYDVLKALLVQDPPIFDNSSDYDYLFRDLGDSLALARGLFPELLQLAAVDDYKSNIQSLLASLVDSGAIGVRDYESYFSQLYFDAKIQWKKQEGRDEKRLQKKGEENEEGMQAGSAENTDDPGNGLGNYAILLMPFYGKNVAVPHFFDRLLTSKDASLRLSTAILLLRNNKPVADSIINTLAASDLYRSLLLKKLRAIHREDRFPRRFSNQLDISRSQLVGLRNNNDLFAIQFVDKKIVLSKQERGYVYFFKYKTNKDDEWQMGISGLQPLNLKDVSTGNDLVRLTNKKIKPDISVADQFDKQLKRILLSRRKSAVSYYLDNDYFPGHGDED
jgi:uncharacterized protein YbaP (TraB family)